MLPMQVQPHVKGVVVSVGCTLLYYCIHSMSTSNIYIKWTLLASTNVSCTPSKRYASHNGRGGASALRSAWRGRPHHPSQTWTDDFARHTASCGISVPKRTGSIVYSADSVLERSLFQRLAAETMLYLMLAVGIAAVAIFFMSDCDPLLNLLPYDLTTDNSYKGQTV